MEERINLETYFKRQIELWGIEKQIELSKKSILIVGAGGLGSSLAFALGSIGIGKISIIDFDEVAIHNIHRQIAFKLEDNKKFKADVVKSMIKSRSEFTDVETFIENFQDFSKREHKKFDLIFDATDNLKTRVEIDQYAKNRDINWIYGSVESFYGQVCFFDKSSFQTFKNSDIKPKGVSTPIVMQIASFQANLGLKYLLGDEVKKDTLYLLSFDKNGVFQAKNFGMPT